MKPILFNTEMVRAILDGRKSVTRRVVKAPVLSKVREPDKVNIFDGKITFSWDGPDTIGGFSVKSPYRPGNILYVRETWANYSYDNTESNAAYYLYRADYEPNAKGYWYEPEHIHFCDFPRWRPSIHMPKEAARLFLRVTGVRVERLQDITRGQAHKEGQPCCLGLSTCGGPAGCTMCEAAGENSILWLKRIWDSTIKKAELPLYGWAANPWAWVIEFERISKEEALKGGETV